MSLHNHHVYTYFRWKAFVAGQLHGFWSVLLLEDFAEQELYNQRRQHEANNDSDGDTSTAAKA